MRGCACGDRDGVSSPELGVAHVSCLAEQAKLLVAEAEENNLGAKAWNERWRQWYTCSLCEQNYHGVVRCALGWACWKTYVGRPDKISCQFHALAQLGIGLRLVKRFEEALSVARCELAHIQDNERNVDLKCQRIASCQGDIAIILSKMGKCKEAAAEHKNVYDLARETCGVESPLTLGTARNFACSLIRVGRSAEARSLVLKYLPIAQRIYGGLDNAKIILMRAILAETLWKGEVTLDDATEAVAILEDISQRSSRVNGISHPKTLQLQEELKSARMVFDVARARPAGIVLVKMDGGRMLIAGYKRVS